MNFPVSNNALPLIRQDEKSECGLACLAMVLGYHGYKTDMGSLRRLFPSSCRGANLKSLIDIAGKLKLIARPLRLELEELKRLQLPVILHWDLEHFVVLASIRNGKYLVYNPARGGQEFTLQSLGKHFTGIALEFTPDAKFVQQDVRQKLGFTEVLKKAGNITPGLLQLLILSVLLQLFTLALPFYTQIFLDDVLVSRDFQLLNVIASGFLLITVIRCLTDYIRSMVVIHLGNKVSFQFATVICQHLLKLPLDYFNRRHLGDIVSRFSSMQKIKDFICSGLIEVLIDGVMVVGTLALMFFYSLKLSLVAMVAVVLYGILRFGLYEKFRNRSEEQLIASADENSCFMENIRGMQAIKLFAQESHRLSLWQNLYADAVNAAVKIQYLGVSVKFIHGLLVGLENIILMLLGGYAVLNNKLSVGMIIAFISFKDQFYARVFALMDKMFEFKLLDVHLQRLADIVYTKAEPGTGGIGLPPPDVCLTGGLCIENVSFRYSIDLPPVLENVSLEIGQDESIAIIGPSGCGKSTFVKVVMSLLQPDTGVISLYQMPVLRMGLSAYRSRIAGVLQDDVLLSGSILDNISMFDPMPDLEKVEFVCNLAAIAKDIRVMPMQYRTLVGGMGANLSGGQVQRILLARALYKQPSVLVLDEATSHLDVRLEKAVNTAIRQLQIARLIIAHRPETIIQADRIMRFRNGALEQVDHSEIMART